MARVTTLTRIIVFLFGCLLLFLNQRWLFLNDNDCHYRMIFLWFYLQSLPELLAYAVSLAVNLLVASMVIRGLFPRRDSTAASETNRFDG